MKRDRFFRSRRQWQTPRSRPPRFSAGMRSEQTESSLIWRLFSMLVVNFFPFLVHGTIRFFHFQFEWLELPRQSLPIATFLSLLLTFGIILWFPFWCVFFSSRAYRSQSFGRSNFAVSLVMSFVLLPVAIWRPCRCAFNPFGVMHSIGRSGIVIALLFVLNAVIVVTMTLWSVASMLANRTFTDSSLQFAIPKHSFDSIVATYQRTPRCFRHSAIRSSETVMPRLVLFEWISRPEEYICDNGEEDEDP
mmetsp:Transcript_4204/g.9416  ORF Transcript_4204/g.9416 Transcript_4204/m.9416 type:complete len:248 (+) Transcript_4204:1088-1831(+)